MAAESDHSGEHASPQDASRVVVRAACLNCRQAKRKCDGVAPVCGPCSNRGVEEGGCNFVSSRRGGPRYKGVKGEEAARVKAERDRQREEQKYVKDRVRRQRDNSALSSSNGGTIKHHDGIHTDSGSSSQASTSPSQDWPRHPPRPSSTTSVPTGSHPSYGSPSVMAPGTSHYPTPVGYGSAGMPQAFPTNAQQAQGMPQHLSAMNSAASTPFGQPPNALPSAEEYLSLGSGELLSFANLELWQRIQERTAVHTNGTPFSDFFSRVEVLPKAGIIGGDHGACADPLDVLMDWEGGETGGNVQDNEQGVRTLLSDFYELVYPACPVLPSPGSLPSLAFYFSGKGPCGLFAAISAVVALHLPNDEAYKTLKASQHPLQRYESSPTDGSMHSNMSHMKPADDVAAYHAKTSEYILHQWQENKRTCFMDPTAFNPFADMDEELITIEGAAAHTLLCMYYYGSGRPLGHQRAYKHAVEAWNLMENFDLGSKSSFQSSGAPEEKANSARPFAAEIKLEWAKRVYWCAYAAATVMSCTGGFAPFGNPKDGVMDLRLRPSLEDVSAWSVMVRGAQQVSRAYRLLYELDQLRTRVAERGPHMDAVEMQQATMDRQTIFNGMLKLDTDIGNYTRFDAGWRDPPPDPGDQGFKTADKELARSLKASGRLMTSGAMIILHRAQAFSNARVFMEPQCGIPEASRLQSGGRVDSIMHYAQMHELPPPRLGETPPSTFASSMQHQSRGGHHNESGDWSSQTQSVSTALHPFLTDRFSGGPFEPPHSLERCRFAAGTMVATLPRVLRDNSHAPKLPPYSACSYVLGAYAILMLTLLIQVRSEMAAHANGNSGGGGESRDGEGNRLTTDPGQLRIQLELHRAPVRDIIFALKRFAGVWNKAVEYENEVSTLLAANEILG